MIKIKQPVLRVQKDRNDSKSGQIVFHIWFNVTYYIHPDTANGYSSNLLREHRVNLQKF